MKKIFSIILSLHLIVTPIAAVAEEELYTLTGTGSRDGIALYLNSVVVTSSGVVGSKLYQCTAVSYTFSHYIFMAGAVTLLASEIAKATQEKEAIELKQKQIENQTLASQKPGEGLTAEQKDTQVDLLEAAKTEEERIRDILQNRMNWMTAVEVVYWLAVGGAVAEILLHAFSTYTGYTDDSLTCNDTSGSKNLNPAMIAIIAAYGFNYSAAATQQWGQVLMQGVQAGAYIKALKNADSFVSKTINSGVKNSALRAVTFGVFAGYATYVRTGYKKNKDRADKNIETLNALINEWKNASISETTIEPGDVPTQNNNPTNQPGTIKPLPVNQLAQATNCVSAGSSGLEVSSNACKNPIKFDRSSLKFDSPYLQSMSNLSMDMADAMARGDSASAQIAVNQLNANASRIKKEVATLLKKADEKLKKAGKPSLNLASSIPSQIASLEGDIKKMAMDSKLPTTDAPAVAQETKSEKDNAPVAVAPIVVVPEVKPDTGLLVGESAEISAVAAPEPESIDNFVLNENDVLKKPEVSIFKQLSNRYFLNLPKILERKKVEEPVKK